MQNYPYLIIGGGIAGGKAIEGIREMDPDGRIALVTREPHQPYQRPPLSKKLLRGEVEKDAVYFQDEDFYSTRKIDLHTGVKATSLDPEKRQVQLENGETLQYEKLLLATGGTALKLDLPGSDLKNVFTLRTLEDSIAIRNAAQNAETAIVMGGSFIGAEVAASLSQSGLNVTEMFPESRILERIVPEAFSEHLREMYREHGISLLPEKVASRIDGDDAVREVILNNGIRIFTDLVVMGVGIKLNTELAETAGLDLRDSDRAVRVDTMLRTSDPNIFAAGDIAAWPDETFDTRLRVEHWDVARAQGLQAGRNMAGAEEPYTLIPYFFSDLFDLSFEVWGNLSSWDETVLRGSYESGSFAVYYFEDGRLTGVLAANRPEEEREAMQDLVAERASYDSIAEELENEEKALSEIA